MPQVAKGTAGSPLLVDVRFGIRSDCDCRTTVQQLVGRRSPDETMIR